MKVIEKGIYVANATLTEFPCMRAQDLVFSSSATSFVAIVPIWGNISLMQNAVYLTYSNSYDAVNDVYAVTVVYTYSTGVWNDDAYRTLVVSEDTTVEDSVKLWFNENFTFYPESTTDPEPGPEPDPEPNPDPTVDLKPVYLRQNGAWNQKEAYERQNGQWVQISSKENPDNGSKQVSITLDVTGDVSALEIPTYVKFGSAPTSETDYDYACLGNTLEEWSPIPANPLTVSSVAYIWGHGYIMNDTYVGDYGLIGVPMSYKDAAVVELKDGDKLQLWWSED